MTSDDPRIMLLADLLKLLKKHGEQSFHSLARALRDPQVAETLTTVLQETPKRNPKKSAGSKTQKKLPKPKRTDESPATSLSTWSEIILSRPDKKEHLTPTPTPPSSAGAQEGGSR